VAWFYEIRSSNNAVLKRDSGFATQDTAKPAGCADAKEMKNSRLRLKGNDFGGQARRPDRPDVGAVMVGQNADKPTRY
jgi:hypothetical protein